MAMRWRSVAAVAKAAHGASVPGSAPWSERLSAIPRLARSVFAGEYPGLSRARLLAMAAAALYVVAPVDLVPEALFGPFGFGDDAVAIAWLAAALAGETQSFLDWERRPQDTVRFAGR